MTEGIETTFKTQLSSVSVGKYYRFDDFCIVNSSGIARAFPGGRIAHPEHQNEDKSKENLRKNKKKWWNSRKNEESRTLAHPGLWGWLCPWWIAHGALRVCNDLMGQRSNLKGRHDGHHNGHYYVIDMITQT